MGCSNRSLTSSLIHWQLKFGLSRFTVITPLKDGNVRIVQQMLIDPGGSLPAFIANMFVTDGPYYTFLNFKKLVALEENCTFKSKNILEPD